MFKNIMFYQNSAYYIIGIYKDLKGILDSKYVPLDLFSVLYTVVSNADKGIWNELK